jgi:hypothetical protein
MSDQLHRPRKARGFFDVGKTKFEEDIAPHLEKVILGPRAVAFTDSSIQRLIRELVAESASAKKIIPSPNNAVGRKARVRS